ncbi:carbamate kinase [candidate division MSBL1 archaeon SCGC-AAA259J03]|uniref:Carbamate kinase n=1 Tax=candidate division MSBL1 archaeon SCGC-AAA259J03 TaxID=1698269 RepID=A0A656YVW5_9EURY|nr:carbamate kinase [candidate division MSBL1 archaeon SCGC-AAA259J03]
MAGKKSKMVIALGGNAIKHAGQEGTTEEQFENVSKTARQIGEIIENGEYKVILTHGNGPQAGNLLIQQEDSDRAPAQDLHVIGGMTQGQIGYMIQNELENYFKKRGMVDCLVVTIINQVRVSEDDPEFEKDSASKPVGPFYKKEKAMKMKEERNYLVKEVDPTREKSWRRVVPSPEPLENMEVETIRKLVKSGVTVIASGGGGIPVVERNGELKGVNAVIDKDKAGELLASEVNADIFMNLTDVEKAKLNFGTSKEQDIDEMSLTKAERYIKEGHFLTGSMLPKVEACKRFIENGGERAIITHLDKAIDALEGRTGTHILPD